LITAGRRSTSGSIQAEKYARGYWWSEARTYVYSMRAYTDVYCIGVGWAERRSSRSYLIPSLLLPILTPRQHQRQQLALSDEEGTHIRLLITSVLYVCFYRVLRNKQRLGGVLERSSAAEYQRFSLSKRSSYFWKVWKTTHWRIAFRC
jgi:hypothetical protein